MEITMHVFVRLATLAAAVKPTQIVRDMIENQSNIVGLLLDPVSCAANPNYCLNGGR